MVRTTKVTFEYSLEEELKGQVPLGILGGDEAFDDIDFESLEDRAKDENLSYGAARSVAEAVGNSYNGRVRQKWQQTEEETLESAAETEKVSQDEIELAIDYILENPDATLFELNSYVYKETEHRNALDS